MYWFEGALIYLVAKLGYEDDVINEAVCYLSRIAGLSGRIRPSMPS